MSLGQLEGRWPVVEGHGDAYRRTAAAIEQAIAHLDAIRDEEATRAQAFDRVREAAGEVAEQLGRATSRYAVAGEALVDYAEQLRVAQDEADEADARWRAADAAATAAAAERDRLAVQAAGADASAALVAEQQRVVEQHAAAREAAADAWALARERKERAAADAAARIRAEVAGSSLRDSLWDDVRGAVGDLLEAVADALVEAIRWLGAIVIAAVAVVVAAALAIAVMATGLVGLLIGGLALLVLGSWVAGGGYEAFVRTLVATGSLEAALVGGTIGWLHGTLPWLADWLVAGDAGAPQLVWTGAQPARTGEPGGFGDHLARLQADNRGVDAHAGGPTGTDPAASTMVTVTAVTDGAATVWRVHIPSTQMWKPGSSSINDVHAGVAATLGDGPTQLERAVVEAMRQAGVPEGASVLLSGWSLGGLTAARLAADPAFTAAYDVDAVVVAGAGIDATAIGGHIPVLAFEHGRGDGTVDPVPLAEDPRLPSLAADAHRTTVRVPPPGLAGPVPHDGRSYQATMQEQGDLAGSRAATWMALHDLERYFVGLEQPHSSIFVRGR